MGVKTVQFCTIATKHGYGIIHELESGTSFLMQERGIRSMKELIGIAQPHPITDFMALSPVKWLSEAEFRSVRFLRQLRALPVPGDRAGCARPSSHRPRPLHRLLDLRSEMLCRRDPDAARTPEELSVLREN